MTDLRISVRNTSDDGGTFLTPFYFGFHDGGFDLFDAGSPASAGLEALAEDGNFAPLTAERIAASPDSVGLVVAGAAGPIATQERASNTVTIDGQVNAEVSFGAMILPSNDAFIGTDDSLKLFDAEGNFIGAQVITFRGTDVYDAGTEVNTELDAAFINQTGPDTGVDQNGVVALHPGFNGSIGNPVGEGGQVILGSTNAFGEAIDETAADFTRPGAEIAEIHINTFVEHQGSDKRDFILGKGDDDIVEAGAGNDIIFGRAGWDDLKGEAGADKIFGGRGADMIDGGTGNDWINGGRDDDVIYGGDGADVARGGSGDDLLVGGRGNDVLSGNRGDDVFVFSAGDGDDVIRDFGRRGDDLLVLDIEGIETVGRCPGVRHTDQIWGRARLRSRWQPVPQECRSGQARCGRLHVRLIQDRGAGRSDPPPRNRRAMDRVTLTIGNFSHVHTALHSALSKVPETLFDEVR